VQLPDDDPPERVVLVIALVLLVVGLALSYLITKSLLG